MTVETMKELFIRTLKKDNTVFDDFEEPNEKTIVLILNGDNLNKINIYISFGCLDNGANLVSFGCYDLPNFSKHYEIGLNVCNQLNDDELVKYYIDEDGDAVAQGTLLYNAYNIKNDFSPEQVLTYASMMALSVDDAYPVLERAKWA